MPSPSSIKKRLRGFKDAAGDVAGFAGDVLQEVTAPARLLATAPYAAFSESAREEVGDAFGDVQRAVSRPAAAVRSYLASSDEGVSPFLGGSFALASTRGAIQGFREPEEAPVGMDIGAVQKLSDEGFRKGPVNITPRTVAGALYDTATDPLSFVPIGRGGKSAAELAGRGTIKGAKATRGLKVGMSVEDVGGAPPRPPAPPVSPNAGKPPIESVFDLIVPGEKPDIGVLRLYDGALNTQGLEIKRDLERGNRVLKALKIGKPTGTSRVVERFGEGEDLFKALHGEGPVPPRLAAVFDDLKAAVDAETAATLDFDPKFMAHPDYFPRGWREVDVSPPRRPSAPSGRGSVGATPGFAKPRVDETFSEILEKTYTRTDGSQYKLEPRSWNPYEMLALRRVAGAEYREQKVLVDRLRETGQALTVDGPLPEGWRIPRVGPAFEGKPKIAPPDAANAAPSFFGYTDRIATTDRVADVLENQYGRSVSLGKGPEAVLSALQGAKRVKLLSSLFQQVDFSTRTGFSMFAGATDDLLSGKPISAVAKAVRAPVEIGNILRMNVSPQGRAALRDEILSGKPIFKERPGLTLRGVAEAGWQQQDITLVRKDISNTLKDLAARSDPRGLSGLPSAAKRNLLRLEAANSRGLFDGVYPQAQTVALKNWILPRLMRQHPEWTDAQLMGNAATEVNKAFSTLGQYQTWFKNPYVNHLTRNLIFSTNEAQAIVRGAGSAFLGPNKRMWTEFYLGGAMFLGVVANLVHMATTALETGVPEPLPIDRYNPLRTSEETPLGIEYNSAFMSPNVPIRGKDDKRLTLDTMGQMDTAFRVLDPVWFLRSRYSVGASAITNQLQGRDFYWNDIDTVGPKGLISRAAQLATDLYEPISAAHIRQGLEIGAEKREPVGLAGEAIQAAGLNLRQGDEDGGALPGRLPARTTLPRQQLPQRQLPKLKLPAR